MEEYFKTAEGKEVLVRGTYLSMAADVEWILSMLLAQCFKNAPDDLDMLYNKPITRLTLMEKIGATQIGLIRYYPLAFKEHMEDFKKLLGLRDMRNKFAHGKMDFSDKPNEVWITEMKDTGLVKNVYVAEDLLNEINQYRASIISFLTTIGKMIGALPQN